MGDVTSKKVRNAAQYHKLAASATGLVKALDDYYDKWEDYGQKRAQDLGLEKAVLNSKTANDFALKQIGHLKRLLDVFEKPLRNGRSHANTDYEKLYEQIEEVISALGDAAGVRMGIVYMQQDLDLEGAEEDVGPHKDWHYWE